MIAWAVGRTELDQLGVLHTEVELVAVGNRRGRHRLTGLPVEHHRLTGLLAEPHMPEVRPVEPHTLVVRLAEPHMQAGLEAPVERHRTRAAVLVAHRWEKQGLRPAPLEKHRTVHPNSLAGMLKRQAPREPVPEIS